MYLKDEVRKETECEWEGEPENRLGCDSYKKLFMINLLISWVKDTVFGEGAIKEIKKEIQLLGIRNALVISTPGKSGMQIANKVAKLLGKICQGVYPQAIQHVPIDRVHESIDYVH